MDVDIESMTEEEIEYYMNKAGLTRDDVVYNPEASFKIITKLIQQEQIQKSSKPPPPTPNPPPPPPQNPQNYPNPHNYSTYPNYSSPNFSPTNYFRKANPKLYNEINYENMIRYLRDDDLSDEVFMSKYGNLPE